MKKLNQWFKSGKGRGLKVFTIFSIILSILTGVAFYVPANILLKSQPVQAFIKSIPTFEIDDGEITNNQLKWTGTDPLLGKRIFIDTSVDTLELPVPEYGIYVSRKSVYMVSPENVEMANLPDEDAKISSTIVAQTATSSILISSLLITLLFFGIFWASYLATVLITYLIATIFKQNVANKRVWRISVVTVIGTWVLNALLFVLWYFAISNMTFIFGVWPLIFIAVIANILILAKNK